MGDSTDEAEKTDAADRESQDDKTQEERLIPDDEISDDGQVYVKRDDLDFDPEEGLYSGTAVHGGTDIPGPHEQVDDVDPDESSDESDGDSDGDSD